MEETRDALDSLRNKYSHSRVLDQHMAQDNDLDFLRGLSDSYAHQPIFLQAVEEMAISLKPLFDDSKDGEFYKKVFLIMAEPERLISFRINWVDDQGILRQNKGWRVEFSSVLGPYKGGLRFHPTVNEDIVKFLGWDQIFKSALTGLGLGSAKGGSDFDPKGKSETEIKCFCESFMMEMYRYLHPSLDILVGDIGVGMNELGYLFGQYKHLANRNGDSVLMGEPIELGGSELRVGATGYGLIHIAVLAIERSSSGGSLSGSRCVISGSGNVSLYAAKKLIDLGAKVMTLSDSNGLLLFENGLNQNELDEIIEVNRGRLSSFKLGNGCKYIPKQLPWDIKSIQYDYAFPCATQNEIDYNGAQTLIRNGVRGLFEGATMPITKEGREIIQQAKMLYIPDIAAAAGGIAVSGLEMSLNVQHLQWTEEEVDGHLKRIMSDIYLQIETSDKTLAYGAHRSAFLSVAHAMKSLGWVF